MKPQLTATLLSHPLYCSPNKNVSVIFLFTVRNSEHPFRKATLLTHPDFYGLLGKRLTRFHWTLVNTLGLTTNSVSMLLLRCDQRVLIPLANWPVIRCPFFLAAGKRTPDRRLLTNMKLSWTSCPYIVHRRDTTKVATHMENVINSVLLYRMTLVCKKGKETINSADGFDFMSKNKPGKEKNDLYWWPIWLRFYMPFVYLGSQQKISNSLHLVMLYLVWIM